MHSIPLRNGLNLPALGAGTWRMGGDFQRDWANDDAADVRALRAAIDAGIGLIDTAEVYAEGHAEQLVAAAIRHHDRSALFIMSKVWTTHLGYADLLRAAEGSLQRLGTDYLDLYFVHMPSDTVPLAETMAALDLLVDQGKIRGIGVSNFSREQCIAAQACTRHPIVAHQFRYNLAFRQSECDGLVDHCRENGIAIITWRSVKEVVRDPHGADVLEVYCRKYGKTPGQVALNWLLSQPQVAALSTMRRIAHIHENLGATDWRMADEDIAALRRDYPPLAPSP